MNVTAIRFLGGAIALVVLAAGLWPDSGLSARPLDALDDPSAITAAPDGGIWVALQTDTVAGLSYYPPDRSSHLDFMAWVWDPSLAVSDDRDLYVGGHSASMVRGSRIIQFSADGRHQRSWARHPTVIVDLDLTADDELAALEVPLDSEDAHVWPPIADRIVHYSLKGHRLREEHFEDSMTQLAAAKDGSLHVARRGEGGRSHVVQLLPDGSSGATLDLDGEVVGMDLDQAGLLFVAEVSSAGHGGVVRFRIIDGAYIEIGSWEACHEPRDLTVGIDGRVSVLARTPVTEASSSISAICEYDTAGELLQEIQIPGFTGSPAPTATPRPGEVVWLPSLIRHRH